MGTYRTPGGFTLDGKHDQTFTDVACRHVSECLLSGTRVVDTTA